MLHAGVALAGRETLWSFVILQGLKMFCFGLIAGNFGALSMEFMGHIAGTAASAQGFFSTTIGALVGIAIGQLYNGGDVPLTVGAAVLGLLALAAVLFAEDGRMLGSGRPVAAPAAH